MSHPYRRPACSGRACPLSALARQDDVRSQVVNHFFRQCPVLEDLNDRIDLVLAQRGDGNDPITTRHGRGVQHGVSRPKRTSSMASERYTLGVNRVPMTAAPTTTRKTRIAFLLCRVKARRTSDQETVGELLWLIVFPLELGGFVVVLSYVRISRAEVSVFRQCAGEDSHFDQKDLSAVRYFDRRS